MLKHLIVVITGVGRMTHSIKNNKRCEGMDKTVQEYQNTKNGRLGCLRYEWRLSTMPD